MRIVVSHTIVLNIKLKKVYAENKLFIRKFIPKIFFDCLLKQDDSILKKVKLFGRYWLSLLTSSNNKIERLQIESNTPLGS